MSEKPIRNTFSTAINASKQFFPQNFITHSATMAESHEKKN